MPNFTLKTVFSGKDKISGVFKRMGKNSGKFGKTSTRAFRESGKAAKKFGSITAGILKADIIKKALSGSIDLMKKFVTEASKVENATADFKTLTGSIETAEKLVKSLQDTAASTPFQFEGLAKQTKTLIGFGVATEKSVVPILRMLGDTAGGSSEKLDRITLAYSQILASGKISLQDLNQLTNAGIPILGQLASQWGVTIGQAREMAKTMPATEVTKAFKAMTSSGGKFFKGMDTASKTFTGRMSTLRDNVNLTFAAIGKGLLPVLKKLTDQTIKITGKIREFVSANEKVLATGIEKFFKFLVEIGRIVVPIFRSIVGIFTNLIDRMKEAFSIQDLGQGTIQFFLLLEKTVFFLAETINSLVNGIFKFGESADSFQAIGKMVFWVKETFATWFEEITKIWGVLKDVGFIKILINLFKILQNVIIIVVKALNFAFKVLGPIIRLVLKLLTPVFKVIEGITFLLAKATSLGAGTSAGVKSIANENLSDIEQELRISPNKAEAQQQAINFTGKLDITGAPKGSSFEGSTIGANPLDVELLGENP